MDATNRTASSSMASDPQKGTLFWWKPQGEPKRHLHLVASHPSGPLVIVVSIQSYRTGYDMRCLLNESGKPKDIQALPWTSIPSCAHSSAMTPQKLIGIVASKECKVITEVVGQPLINRILTNLHINKNNLQPGVFEVLEEMLRATRQAAVSQPPAPVAPVPPPKKRT